LKQGQVTEGQASATDDAIVGRILRGQIDHFSLLLNRYQRYVFRIVSGFLPPGAVADFCHDIFVEAYRSLAKYENGTIFKSWLTGIAVHCCHDYWRQHYRNREIPLSSLTENHQDWLDTVIASEASEVFASAGLQKEAGEILQQAVAGLSVKDRMLLTLVHLEGFSVRETARILGWSTINVKVRAHRSRQKLRRQVIAMLQGGR
jgi:RNA polymerase sigma-70 factor, ECF subfamily